MPADFTPEEFIRFAQLAHGNIYDYSATRYRGIQASIWVSCRLHGCFQLTAEQHLNGGGCPVCRAVTS